MAVIEGTGQGSRPPLRPRGCEGASLAPSSTSRLAEWTQASFNGAARGLSPIPKPLPRSGAIGRSSAAIQEATPTNGGGGGGGTPGGGGTGAAVSELEFISAQGSAAAADAPIVWDTEEVEPRSRQGFSTTVLPTSELVATIDGEARFSLYGLAPGTVVTVEVVRDGGVVGAPMVYDSADF